jgi:hypothetical protein
MGFILFPPVFLSHSMQKLDEVDGELFRRSSDVVQVII